MMNVTIIMRTGVTSWDEIAATGEVSLEPTLEWVDEMDAAGRAIEVLASGSTHLDLRSTLYLPPAGRSLRQFQLVRRALFVYSEYQFDGTTDELGQLIDRIQVVQGRQELASMN